MYLKGCRTEEIIPCIMSQHSIRCGECSYLVRRLQPKTDVHERIYTFNFIQMKSAQRDFEGLSRLVCLKNKKSFTPTYFNTSTWEVDALFQKKEKKKTDLKIWSGTDSVEQLEGLQQVSDSRVVGHQETVSEHEAQRVFEHQDVLQQDGGGQRRPPVLCRT